MGGICTSPGTRCLERLVLVLFLEGQLIHAFSWMDVILDLSLCEKAARHKTNRIRQKSAYKVPFLLAWHLNRFRCYMSILIGLASWCALPVSLLVRPESTSFPTRIPKSNVVLWPGLDSNELLLHNPPWPLLLDWMWVRTVRHLTFLCYL